MKRQRTIALFLALALMLSMLSACGTNATTAATGAQTTKGGETAKVQLDDAAIKALTASHTDSSGKTFVTVALPDDPGSMNPYGTGSSKPRQVVLEGIFEGLFCIQGTGGELKPVLAESYKVLEDGFTYQIKLKNYIKDAKGNPFTAKDVYFTLEEVARKEYNWATSRYIKEVRIVDDYTVNVVFNTRMYNYIVNVLIGYMFTEASYKSSKDKMITTPVGTGPYVLANWVSGSEMVFESRKDYWEKDPAKIFRNSLANVDRMTFKIIKDSAQRVIALESKTVDICTGVSATDVKAFKSKTKDYSVYETLNDQVVSIAFNCSKNSPMQNVKARQAVAYAIDSLGVLNGVDQGFGKVCHTAFLDIFPDYNKKWDTEDYYNYNAAKARELLKEAGVASGTRLKIMFEYNDRLASVAQVVQGYLSEVGIQLEIMPIDGALFTTYRFDNTKADLLMFTAGSSTFGSSALIGNLNAIADNKTLIGIKEDKLMEKITAMAENAYKDWSFANDLHYYVKDNVYIYSLYAPIDFTVTSRVVTKFVLNQKGKDSPNCCTYIWNK